MEKEAEAGEGPEGSGGEEGDKRRRQRGHAKTNSISEKERKIGHRRINEEGQVRRGSTGTYYLGFYKESIFGAQTIFLFFPLPLPL
jgi:hypothetical protein